MAEDGAADGRREILKAAKTAADELNATGCRDDWQEYWTVVSRTVLTGEDSWLFVSCVPS